MGRLTKNPQLASNAGAAASGQMPGGTTAERPDVTNNGQVRWNETTLSLEYFDGTVWQQVGATGLSPITKDSFTGNAVLVNFTMSISVAATTDILVFVGGVFQNPTVSYTVSTTTITFTSAPPNLETIIVLHGLNEVT